MKKAHDNMAQLQVVEQGESLGYSSLYFTPLQIFRKQLACAA